MLSVPLGFHRRWSDIVGFIFFAGLGISVLIRMPEAAILLLPSVGKELFTAYTFLTRDAPRRTIGTLPARFAAYGSAFWMIACLHVIRSWRPDSFALNTVIEVAAFGGVLWLGGAVLVLVSMWSLRFAFSIEPEARRIVRGGPYRIVRHPIYAAYILQYTGIWLMSPSTLLASVMLVWVAITLVRMHFEEKVLTETFPEYETYKRTTGALVPLPGLPASRPQSV